MLLLINCIWRSKLLILTIISANLHLLLLAYNSAKLIAGSDLISLLLREDAVDFTDRLSAWASWVSMHVKHFWLGALRSFATMLTVFEVYTAIDLWSVAVQLVCSFILWQERGRQVLVWIDSTRDKGIRLVHDFTTCLRFKDNCRSAIHSLLARLDFSNFRYGLYVENFA